MTQSRETDFGKRDTRAERVLRQVRLRIFDYIDAGQEAKAYHVMETCKRILAPLWEARKRGIEVRRLRNYGM